MNTWRICTARANLVVIEPDPDGRSRMTEFDSLTEEEMVDVVKTNILELWPSASLHLSSYQGHSAISVSCGKEFRSDESASAPLLVSVARGSWLWQYMNVHKGCLSNECQF